MNVSACTEVDIILTDYAGVFLRFFWSEKNSDPNVASFSILYVIIVQFICFNDISMPRIMSCQLGVISGEVNCMNWSE